MAGSGGFSVRIAAVDQATPVLDRINKRIAAMNAPAERTAKALAKFGDVTGISRLTEGMGGLAHNALDAFRSVDRIASPLAAITGAGSIAGMTLLVNRWAELGTQVSQTSFRLNMGAGRLTNMEGAARLAGVSTGTLDSGLEGLGKTLSDATFGRNPEAVRTFNQLGIAFKDANGHARQAADVLPEIADALNKFPDARTKGRVLDLTGVGSGLLPVLKDGSKGLEDLRERAKSLGGGMTDEMADHANKARASFEGLSEAIEGVGNRLADQASGPLTKWMDKTSDWIAKNKETSDTIGKIGAGLTALAAIRPAAWVLRLLGLGAVADVAAPAAVLASPLLLGGDTVQNANRSFAGEGDWDNPYLDPRNPNRAVTVGQWWGRHAPSWLGGDPSPSPPAADVSMDPTKRGLLDTIAGPESRGDYQIRNGGSRFSDLSQFPDGVGPGGTSTASGRYQFTAGTWKSVSKSLGLHDFGKESQDKGGWYLAATAYRAKTGRDLEQDLKEGGHEAQIADGLKEQWPSLPGGTQQGETLDQFKAALGRNAASEAALGAAPAAPAAPNGNVHVQVTLKGAPAGTTAAVTTQGQVTAAPPRIETSMPMAR